MTKTPADPEGMGTEPRGPNFTSPSADMARAAEAAWQAAHPSQSLPRVDASQFRPPRSKTPAVLTAVVVLVVALVVAGATWFAHLGDASVAGPTPSPEASRAQPTQNGESIEFTSSEGSGKLVVLSHDWISVTGAPAQFGQFLRIQVELSSSVGRISYDPYFFQAFDADGNLFDTTEAGAVPPLLGTGTLAPGQQTRGFISFDIPRGDVTLLLSNDRYESVTALKIRD